MKSLTVILGILCISAGFAQIHDLAVTEIVVPSNTWVQDGAEVIPQVQIANLGNEQETFVPVKLTIENENTETVYTESTILYYIGEASSGFDTVEIELPVWIPEGTCEDWQAICSPDLPGLEDVGMHYELIVVVEKEEDQNPDNDSSVGYFAALFSRDVGVVDLNNVEGHEWGNLGGGGVYPAGTEFTCIATVENFGFEEKYNIPVDLEILDVMHDPDSLVWHNIQLIEYLDWRGNENGNPYRVEIEFPTFKTPERHIYCFECRTELQGDECPENDETIRCMVGINEADESPKFFLNVDKFESRNVNCEISFTVPRSIHVNVEVYDINGRSVKTIADERLNQGDYSLVWDGSDGSGRKVPAGIYMVRMEAGGLSDVKKIIITN